MKPSEEALTFLRANIKAGDTIYTILRHRSASGMSLSISFLVLKPAKGGTVEIRDWSYKIADALGYRMHPKHEGIRVDGCGRDMGFHVVYALGATLWPKGTKKPHGTRNGEPDRTGGYALKHRWL